MNHNDNLFTKTRTQLPNSWFAEQSSQKRTQKNMKKETTQFKALINSTFNTES